MRCRMLHQLSNRWETSRRGPSISKQLSAQFEFPKVRVPTSGRCYRLMGCVQSITRQRYREIILFSDYSTRAPLPLRRTTTSSPHSRWQPLRMEWTLSDLPFPSRPSRKWMKWPNRKRPNSPNYPTISLLLQQILAVVQLPLRGTYRINPVHSVRRDWDPLRLNLELKPPIRSGVQLPNRNSLLPPRRTFPTTSRTAVRIRTTLRSQYRLPLLFLPFLQIDLLRSVGIDRIPLRLQNTLHSVLEFRRRFQIRRIRIRAEIVFLRQMRCSPQCRLLHPFPTRLLLPVTILHFLIRSPVPTTPSRRIILLRRHFEINRSNRPRDIRRLSRVMRIDLSGVGLGVMLLRRE